LKRLVVHIFFHVRLFHVAICWNPFRHPVGGIKGMRLNSLFAKAAVLSGIGALAFGATAQAAPYTINLVSTAGQISSGLFVYQVNLAPNESLVTGDFISIVDFGTFTDASSTQAGFTFTNPATSPTALAGPSPGLLSPPPAGADDPQTGNLLATYTGATLTGVQFNIQATSPLRETRSDFSYGQTSDLTGTTQGKITTITPLAVPGGVIPEPGTMTLLGMGALGALGMVRRRRNAK
jgi:hypothetical protein